MQSIIHIYKVLTYLKLTNKKEQTEEQETSCDTVRGKYN